jgi:hypothetical protein
MQKAASDLRAEEDMLHRLSEELAKHHPDTGFSPFGTGGLGYLFGGPQAGVPLAIAEAVRKRFPNRDGEELKSAVNAANYLRSLAHQKQKKSKATPELAVERALKVIAKHTREERRQELFGFLLDPARWNARLDIARLRVREIFGGGQLPPAVHDRGDEVEAPVDQVAPEGAPLPPAVAEAALQGLRDAHP